MTSQDKGDMGCPMKTQIKICGLSDTLAIEAAARAGADYIGLVHCEKSSRHVSLEQAAQLCKATPESLKTVLLLVNADPKTTGHAINTVRPDIVQFHGNETPEWLKIVRDQGHVEIWKALGVKDKPTLIKSARFNGIADRLLFDAPAKKLLGGTGTAFDWSLLAGHDHQVPWGLAGGLDPQNVAEAIRTTDTRFVDVSSGVESAPGIKDVDKIAAFCQAVQEFDKQQSS